MLYNPLISSPLLTVLTANPQLTNWYNTRHDVSRKLQLGDKSTSTFLGRGGTGVLSW